MREIAESFLEYLASNWPELIWIVLAAGIASYVAGQRARIQWRNRDFLDRLNVSLTSIVDGKMRIRTILEMDVQEVFLNRTASSKIVALAKQTTPTDPIIPIPKDDLWFYLNAVLNEVSERFSDGHLRREIGMDVKSEQFLVCLTCERAGEVRTQKIRAMLVRKDLLESLPAKEPNYESPNHVTRWDTLQVLAERWKDSPHQFLSLELCL